MNTGGQAWAAVLAAGVAGGLTAGHASGQFTFDAFTLLSVGDTLRSANLGPADGPYDGYDLSVDWQAVIGDPWSREARVALASSNDPTAPGFTVYKFLDAPDNGVASNGAPNGNPVRLNWSGPLASAYNGGDLWLLATQTLPGSQAHWVNISLTLNTFTPPPPPPAIRTGATFEEGQLVAFDTFDSLFDTELALYDSNGQLLERADQSPGGNPDTTQIVVGGGLAEGTYYIALTGYNALFDDGFEVSFDTPQGSEGGAYSLFIGGKVLTGEHAPNSVTWFSFQVVPAPGGMLVAGVMLSGWGARRRRGL